MSSSSVTSSHAWIWLVNKLVRQGELTFSRGSWTNELIGTQSIWPMKHPLVAVKNRQLGYRFAFSEAFWICSGSNMLTGLPVGSNVLSKFSDNGTSLFGAYGPKLSQQIDHVVDTLTGDPFSRQAVINIWRENPQQSKDIPCTLSWQFLIRVHGKLPTLDVVSTMRSSDAWLGVPYDVFTVSQVACQVALRLRARIDSHCSAYNAAADLTPGNVILTAGSQHLYMEDFKVVSEWDMSKLEIENFDGVVPFNFMAFDAYPNVDTHTLEMLANAATEYFSFYNGDVMPYKEFTPAVRHMFWLWLVASGRYTLASSIYPWVISHIEQIYRHRSASNVR